MKLLLDQGVPKRAAAILREEGVAAVHTSQIGLASADDSDIIAWCRANEAVAVTLDADFHGRISLSGAAAPLLILGRGEPDSGHR